MPLTDNERSSMRTTLSLLLIAFFAGTACGPSAEQLRRADEHRRFQLEARRRLAENDERVAAAAKAAADRAAAEKAAAKAAADKAAAEKVAAEKAAAEAKARARACLSFEECELVCPDGGTMKTQREPPPPVKYCEKNGKLHGTFTNWYENGQVSIKNTFKDGKLHGALTWWYENGQVSIKRTFKNGKKHGPFT